MKWSSNHLRILENMWKPDSAREAGSNYIRHDEKERPSNRVRYSCPLSLFLLQDLSCERSGYEKLLKVFHGIENDSRDLSEKEANVMQVSELTPHEFELYLLYLKPRFEFQQVDTCTAVEVERCALSIYKLCYHSKAITVTYCSQSKVASSRTLKLCCTAL